MTTHTAHRVSADALSLVKALTVPGEPVLMSWATTVKPAAAHRDRVLVKHTTAAVECGTPFERLTNVRAAIVAGKRGPVGELPWGEWAEDAYPYVIVHRDREYLRVNLAPAGVVKVTTTVDGVEVDRATFDSYLTPSQRAGAKPMPDTVTIPLANIRSIGAVVLAA